MSQPLTHDQVRMRPTYTGGEPLVRPARRNGGPETSKALKKARQQLERGKIQSASRTLWEVRNEVSNGKRDEAQDLLDLALALRDRAEGWVIKECEGHISFARRALAEAEEAKRGVAP
jgi:hypothetical protein